MGRNRQEFLRETRRKGVTRIPELIKKIEV